MDERILIVEDDVGIRNMMQEFISKSGYKAFTASSAEEALELLKSNRVNVVLTDIILPGKDGLELTELIKQKYFWWMIA